MVDRFVNGSGLEGVRFHIEQVLCLTALRSNTARLYSELHGVGKGRNALVGWTTIVLHGQDFIFLVGWERNGEGRGFGSERLNIEY